MAFPLALFWEMGSRTHIYVGKIINTWKQDSAIGCDESFSLMSMKSMKALVISLCQLSCCFSSLRRGLWFCEWRLWVWAVSWWLLCVRVVWTQQKWLYGDGSSSDLELPPMAAFWTFTVCFDYVKENFIFLGHILSILFSFCTGLTAANFFWTLKTYSHSYKRHLILTSGAVIFPE